ncbi:MAG TPA: VWA domain-containing protein [Tepidisphaeraceae bacterium]|nr:VWA domain-containing protein [Tepidisphaeraceae bacterium]
MFAFPAIVFDSPIPLAAGLALAVAAIVTACFRRASAPLVSHVLVGLGLMLLAIAAGEPRVANNADGRIAVMVDLSASTRGATYRDDAALRARVAQLLGDRPHTVVRFGDEQAERTNWPPPPPDAAAVVLFSDGRFDPPATSPPVYAVIDPALDRPADAAVTGLDRRGDQLVINTTNGGAPRELTVGASSTTAPTGARTITLSATNERTTIAQLSPGDAWPENDVLAVMDPPPTASQRWWVGDAAPTGDWRSMSAGALPIDPAAWLEPSVIVLHNVAANSLSPSQSQRLHQYVRDLGGGLLILGGDRAFAAGGHDGSVPGNLSPLASSPPTPAAHWTFLLDASGSMASASNGRTRLTAAVAAAREAIAQLPPSDLLSVGGFADELRWWTRGKPVKDFALADIPAPRGPTNLQAALRAVSASLDKSVANPIVLITDGQVKLPAVDELARTLAAANARVHVLAIGTGPGAIALRRLAEATGGSFVEEADAAGWASALTTLLKEVSPHHWVTRSVEVHFSELPPAMATGWNRTWLKADATELARTTGEDSVPMAARANVGSGKVAAVTFRPPDGHVEALAALVQSPPRDPRLKVTWRTGLRLVIDIDAADQAAPMNGLSPTLVLTTLAGASETFRIPQTGPGRYHLALPAPRATAIATVRESSRMIERSAVAGRYAPEFDGIGNDRLALASLARRTGARVIEPGERGRVQFSGWGARRSIASYVAGAGALLVGMGLVAWSRRGR